MAAFAQTRQLRGVRVPAPAPSVLGAAALAGLVASGALLAVAGAAERRIWYVPSSGRGGLPGWLAGPYHGAGLVLQPPAGAALLVAMTACYLLALACARAGAISARVAVATVVAAHVVFLLAPPLFSADVFGYVDYARLYVLHGLNPYVHGAADAIHDPSVPFIRWHDVPTPYGPLFSLLSSPLAWVSVPVALWACKASAALLSLACVALVWRIARRRDVAPTPAILLVGLNPLLLAYAVGGAHNDFLLLVLLLGGVLLALERRPAWGGAAAVLAAGVKASAALVLPFMLLAPQEGRERRRALLGALAGGAAVVALGAVAFGRDGLGFVGQIHRQQRYVAAESVPRKLAGLLGFDYLPEGLRLVFLAGFAAAVAWLLWATWRRRLDWLAGAGWATLALLLSTAWLVPWYLVWLLPLAAVGRDERLRRATLLFFLYLVWTRVWYLLS